ncbi:hypothetical protein KC362_g22 [Hortaea werneckii]|nr:hypothetical protein KC362_g22 [Hortaea werneckii]
MPVSRMAYKLEVMWSRNETIGRILKAFETPNRGQNHDSSISLYLRILFLTLVLTGTSLSSSLATIFPRFLSFSIGKLVLNCIQLLNHTIKNADARTLGLNGICQVDKLVAVFHRAIAVLVGFGRGFD